MLFHETNQGKGAAVRDGMLAARGRYRLFCDADGSGAIEEEARLRDAIDGGADVAIGSRIAIGATVCRQRETYRSWCGRLFNGLVRHLTGLRFGDTQCGFKMFRGPAAEELFARQRINRFAFDVELLCLAANLGLRTEEVAISWNAAGTWTVRMGRDGLAMAVDVLRMRVRLGRGRCESALRTEGAAA